MWRSDTALSSFVYVHTIQVSLSYGSHTIKVSSLQSLGAGLVSVAAGVATHENQVEQVSFGSFIQSTHMIVTLFDAINMYKVTSLQIRVWFPLPLAQTHENQVEHGSFGRFKQTSSAHPSPSL
jgi:hypothetical protein